MGDALDRVRLPVREVVARVDAPLIARARMRGVQDAVEHRIPQVDVAGSHVDLGAQYTRAVGELARAHTAEQIEILFHAALAERRIVSRLGERAARGAYLRLGLIVDVSLADADQVLAPRVELREIIRRMVEVADPIEA